MPADDVRPAARSSSSRRDPMWLLALAVVLLLVRIGLAFYDRGHPHAVADLVQWRGIAEGPTLARQLDRPILYDFTAEWCPPCQMMNREVFANRRQAEVINRSFVPVRVLDRQREEGHNPPEVDALQRRYKITGFPTLVVVSPDESLQVSIDGYPGRSQTTTQLMAALQTVSAQSPWDRRGGRDSTIGR